MTGNVLGYASPWCAGEQENKKNHLYTHNGIRDFVRQGSPVASKWRLVKRSLYLQRKQAKASLLRPPTELQGHDKL